jgi:hypothetical protein
MVRFSTITLDQTYNTIQQYSASSRLCSTRARLSSAPSVVYVASLTMFQGGARCPEHDGQKEEEAKNADEDEEADEA